MKLPALFAAVFLLCGPALAADYPARTEGDFVLSDFRFHTGEVLPELKLHYTTLGDPSHEAVLMLHGTGGSGASCSGQASRSTPAATSSSCPTASVTAARPSPRTG